MKCICVCSTCVLDNHTVTCVLDNHTVTCVLDNHTVTCVLDNHTVTCVLDNHTVTCNMLHVNTPPWPLPCPSHAARLQPIPIADFPAHVKSLHEGANRGFEEEFTVCTWGGRGGLPLYCSYVNTCVPSSVHMHGMLLVCYFRML